jgi:hypothetical protein
MVTSKFSVLLSGPARGASPVSGLIILISTCCTGRMALPTSRVL